MPLKKPKKPGPKPKPIPPPNKGVADTVNTTTGEKFRTVKWSIHQASVEFDIDHGALTKRLKALSIDPNDEGRFSTMQICAAKYGDYDMERSRKVKEDADGSALDNAKKRNELGEVRQFILFLAEVASAIKQHVNASSMPQQEQDDLNEELAVFFESETIIKKVCPE